MDRAHGGGGGGFGDGGGHPGLAVLQPRNELAGAGTPKGGEEKKEEKKTALLIYLRGWKIGFLCRVAQSAQLAGWTHDSDGRQARFFIFYFFWRRRVKIKHSAAMSD